MTFEQLFCFLEITKDMGFTRAASRLFVSQSTLSRQISSLENDLGVRLLIRDTRSVELTEAGQLLLKEGAELCAKKAEIEEKIWKLNDKMSGRIHIASIKMQTNEVYELCHEFQKRYPDFALSLSTQPNGSSLQMLEQDIADVVVCISCELETAADDLVIVPIKRDRYKLIVPDRHPLAGRESVSPEEIMAEEVLTARSPIPSPLCEDIHHALGVETNRRQMRNQPNTLDETIMQVKAGLGIAIIPGSLCKLGEGYCVLNIDDIFAEFDIIMVWKKNCRNAGMAHFQAVVQELVGPLDGEQTSC